ncbi:MAG TPA: serine hydrolase [Gammaproteobacteria bacterium]|jgi:beta-lactamase class A|nr:serine hydrolase [Gammaproteobacteria bacterium]
MRMRGRGIAVWLSGYIGVILMTLRHRMCSAFAIAILSEKITPTYLLRRCLPLLLLFSTNCFADHYADALLKTKIEKICRVLHCVVGVTAIHIETGQKISYNGSRPFFMASTIKVPIAVALLRRVDEGKEYLGRKVYLTRNQAVPGSGNLHTWLARGRLGITLDQLLREMLVVSDNSASDAVLHEVHGSQAVDEKMRDLGFYHIQVNRSILGMFIDAHGVNQKMLTQPHTMHSLKSSFKAVPLTQKISAWKRFANDRRDTATSDDMARLLVNLYQHKLLSPESSALLLRRMQECRTGKTRIKALLPPYTPVAHKTGTWDLSDNLKRYTRSQQLYSYSHDVGIITLPQRRGHLAIAIYVKSLSNSHSRSRVIALLSKEIYDSFV